MIGSRQLGSLRLLDRSWTLAAAVTVSMLAPFAHAQTAPALIPSTPPAAAQFSAPGLPIAPDAREASGALPCTDCRGGEAGGPGASNTIITTPDNKTTVPRTLMREQSDFRLNEALRNVPGINRR